MKPFKTLKVPITIKQIGGMIDPAGDNDHVLAAAYNLALEHVIDGLPIKYVKQFQKLKITK